MALGEPQSIQRRTRLIIGAVIEQICSILQAPIVMYLHSKHLWEILCGKDSGWSAQRRCGSSFPIAVLLLRHGSQTIIGLAITAYLIWISSALIYWVLPLTLGLIFSVPLSALGGSRQLGRKLAKMRLLLTPDEQESPVIIRRHQQLVELFKL